MLRAGDMDQRVTIQRTATTVDDYGDETEAWSQLGERWAKVRYGTGQERREAAQEAASLTATFTMRRDSLTKALKPADRLLHDGVEWDIVAPPAPTPDRAGIDLTAVRRD